MIDAIIYQVAPIDAHDLLVKSGGMSQILLWTSFLEIFGGIALFQTIQGKRAPGDFKFDPLGLSQVVTHEHRVICFPNELIVNPSALPLPGQQREES